MTERPIDELKKERAVQDVHDILRAQRYMGSLDNDKTVSEEFSLQNHSNEITEERLAELALTSVDILHSPEKYRLEDIERHIKKRRNTVIETLFTYMGINHHIFGSQVNVAKTSIKNKEDDLEKEVDLALEYIDDEIGPIVYTVDITTGNYKTVKKKIKKKIFNIVFEKEKTTFSEIPDFGHKLADDTRFIPLTISIPEDYAEHLLSALAKLAPDKTDSLTNSETYIIEEVFKDDYLPIALGITSQLLYQLELYQEIISQKQNSSDNKTTLNKINQLINYYKHENEVLQDLTDDTLLRDSTQVVESQTQSLKIDLIETDKTLDEIYHKAVRDKISSIDGQLRRS
ncbi:MAG: hypothetical protein WBI29_01665 [Candidatus Saccharimonadales bacterium]